MNITSLSEPQRDMLRCGRVYDELLGVFRQTLGVLRDYDVSDFVRSFRASKQRLEAEVNCRIGGCGLELTPRPVQGAKNYPTRLECQTHGYAGFVNTRDNIHTDHVDLDDDVAEKPNDYVTEICSPADVVTTESGDEFSRY